MLLSPLNHWTGARYVRELGAILAVGVELGPVSNDQTLIRADRARGGEHGQRELAGGRTGVADREVGARDQGPLPGTGVTPSAWKTCALST